MAPRRSHQWEPIEDLPEDWAALANPPVEALVTAWLDQAEELRRGSAYDAFLVKMRREWAIETGFIERLYRISDGATKTLIEQGLDAALLLHDDVDKSPDEVIAIISDQHDAIEGLYQFVSGGRELGKSYIRELHQVLTAHQPKYEAIDTLGNRVVRDLPRGVWKTLPNNVGDLEGDYYFEFCPPEHVEAEVENLLRMHREHEAKEVPPDLEAAWLHHRFTLIHPFTDGNGRVARCLASLVLLKASWFPLVVTRRDTGYIDAIRGADRGDLKPLVDLFGTLQSQAITRAFSLSDELDRESKTIDSILGSVKEKLARARRTEDPARTKVFDIGNDLFKVTSDRLAELAEEISRTIRDYDSNFRAFMSCGRRDDSRAYGLRFQVERENRRLGTLANFLPFHAWIMLTIETELRSEVLFSIHGMGREFAGILVVSAMFSAKALLEEHQSDFKDVESLSNQPFLLSYVEPLDAVVDRYRPWLEERLIVGLDHWRKRVGA